MTKTTEKYANAKRRFEAEYLDVLLRRFSNLRTAAKAAGMDHSTLWRLLRKHGYRPTPSMWERPAALASREPQPALVVKPEHISRVELIDHRRSVDRGGGRQFTAHDVSVELQYQDDGRTLKVFVDNRTALSERADASKGETNGL